MNSAGTPTASHGGTLESRTVSHATVHAPATWSRGLLGCAEKRHHDRTEATASVIPNDSLRIWVFQSANRGSMPIVITRKAHTIRASS